MSDFRLQLGKRIKAARNAAGVSQQGLAEMIERSVHSVSQMERGINAPNAETLKSLSTALGVSADYFLSDLYVEKSSHIKDLLVFEFLASIEKYSDEQLKIFMDTIKKIQELQRP